MKQELIFDRSCGNPRHNDTYDRTDRTYHSSSQKRIYVNRLQEESTQALEKLFVMHPYSSHILANEVFISHSSMPVCMEISGTAAVNTDATSMVTGKFISW
uniref:Bromo domain-containing protein n=1 Tax=Parascaris univalens TaxID=6257 RepID=A0A915A2V0_PARUN